MDPSQDVNQVATAEDQHDGQAAEAHADRKAISAFSYFIDLEADLCHISFPSFITSVCLDIVRPFPCSH